MTLNIRIFFRRSLTRQKRKEIHKVKFLNTFFQVIIDIASLLILKAWGDRVSSLQLGELKWYDVSQNGYM